MCLCWRQAVPVPLGLVGSSRDPSWEDLQHNDLPKGLCSSIAWGGGVALCGLCSWLKKNRKEWHGQEWERTCLECLSVFASTVGRASYLSWYLCLPDVKCDTLYAWNRSFWLQGCSIPHTENPSPTSRWRNNNIFYAVLQHFLFCVLLNLAKNDNNFSVFLSVFTYLRKICRNLKDTCKGQSND